MTWYDGGPPPDPRHDAATPAVAGASRLRAAARRASGVVGAGRAGDGVEWAVGAGDRGVEAEPADADAARPEPADTGGARAASTDAGGALGGSGGGSHAEPVGRIGVAGRADLDEPDGAVGDERLRLDGLVRWRVAPRTVGIALGALLLVGGAVALRSAGQPTGEPVAVEEPAVTAPATEHGDAEPGPTVAEEAVVWVHVVGEVASPGVVPMPAGARVADAVTAAGGALPGADLTALNLAAVVQDGAQIRVPAPGEEPVVVDDAGGGAGSGGGGPAGSAGGAVDVNTAGGAELQTLPGIGPVLAERIVAWREANGPFASVDALLDVSGIGPAVLGQIRDLVRV